MSRCAAARTFCVAVVILDAEHDFVSIVVSNFGRLRLGIVTDSFFCFQVHLNSIVILRIIEE